MTLRGANSSRVLHFGTARAFLFKTPEYFFSMRGAF
jgi:hypothetical protein